MTDSNGAIILVTLNVCNLYLDELSRLAMLFVLFEIIFMWMLICTLLTVMTLLYTMIFFATSLSRPFPLYFHSSPFPFFSCDLTLLSFHPQAQSARSRQKNVRGHAL